MVAPISIADHIRSSVIWIPPVIIAALIASIISISWSFLYNVAWIGNDLSWTRAASWKNAPWRNIWSILKSLCKMLIVAFLFVASTIAAPWAIWWWIWDVATPYEMPSFMEILRGVAIAIIITIFLFIVMLDVFCEKIMNPNRFKCLTTLGLAIFIAFFAVNIAALANFSKSGVKCSQIRTSSFTIGDKKTVVLRRFEKYFLVYDCKENRMEFLSADGVNNITVRE